MNCSQAVGVSTADDMQSPSATAEILSDFSAVSIVPSTESASAGQVDGLEVDVESVFCSASCKQR